MYTMSTTTTRRILCVVPLAAAVVLSVGACGNTPWAKGTNASSSTSSSAANAANSVTSQPVAAPAPAGQSGLSGSTAGGLGSPEDQNTYTFRAAVPDLVELKKHTPVQLQPDVELLANDFKALGDE